MSSASILATLPRDAAGFARLGSKDDATAEPAVQIDNDTVRVTEWRFAAGAATGYHRHEYEYVVVPMTTGKLLLDEPEGKRVAQLHAGVPTRPPVSSTTDQRQRLPFVFIEIEIKHKS